MNVQITHLRAPWPRTSVIGDIIAFKGDAPPWATGKFIEAKEGATPSFTYEPGEADPWKPTAASGKTAQRGA